VFGSSQIACRALRWSPEISLLAGKKQRIFGFRLARAVNGSRISEQPQCVTKEFPARWNREVLGLNRELNWEFRESFMVFNELSIWDVSWHFVLKQNKSAARDEITLTRHSQMGAIFAAANMVIVDFCAAQPDYPIDICAAWVYYSARNSNSGVCPREPRPAGFVFSQ
jgi:hypothetical protein